MLQLSPGGLNDVLWEDDKVTEVFRSSIARVAAGSATTPVDQRVPLPRLPLTCAEMGQSAPPPPSLQFLILSFEAWSYRLPELRKPQT